MKHQKRFFQFFLLSTLTAFLASTVVFAQEDAKESREKMRSRLEQLFIWRVSDRLQLTPDEESKFTDEYKKLSDERTAATQKMDDILTKLTDEKIDKKTKAKLLNDYEAANKKYAQLQENEFKVMKRLFNTEKLTQYVLLKREMFHKFREALGASKATSIAESPDKPKMKEPQIIEEK